MVCDCIYVMCKVMICRINFIIGKMVFMSLFFSFDNVGVFRKDMCSCVICYVIDFCWVINYVVV